MTNLKSFRPAIRPITRVTLLAACSLACTLPSGAKNFLLYFGTYTNALSQGIYVSTLDATTGTLSDPVLAAATPNPCWVSVSPDEKFLYAANSIHAFHGEKTGSVSVFTIDAKTGQLTLVDAKSSGGNGPCYVSVDPSEKVLMVANYGDGTVKSFSIATNGSITADGTLSQHVGHGPNASRQKGPHAHFIATDPTGRYALACDLGLDKVVVYQLDADKGTLELKSGFSTPTVPAGSGARHLAFSKDGKFVYVIGEMGCNVTTLAWHAKDGTFTPVETVSALPDSIPRQDTFTAAEVVVHPSGKFVYTTVRGANIVTVFKANRKTGKLTWLQSTDCGGMIPRGLGVDPTGHWLFTGNQKSDNVAEFSIDTKTGLINATGRQLKIGSPVDVKFVRAE